MGEDLSVVKERFLRPCGIGNLRAKDLRLACSRKSKETSVTVWTKQLQVGDEVDHIVKDLIDHGKIWILF